MRNKPILYIFALILMTGSAAAYSWTASIDDVLSYITCRNCTLDNPTFLNYSFPNGTGNGTMNHSELNELTWSTAGHVLDTNIDLQFFDIANVNEIHTIYVNAVNVSVDSLTNNMNVCTNSFAMLVSCTVSSSSYNSTYENTTNTVNQNLAVWNSTYNSTYDSNMSAQESKIVSLQANDTQWNHIPYPRYNWTDLSSVRYDNTAYWNNNTYPIYINSQLIVTSSQPISCWIDQNINGVRIGTSYTNIQWLTSSSSFDYILSPGSNYSFSKSGKVVCVETIYRVYEHPYY